MNLASKTRALVGLARAPFVVSNWISFVLHYLCKGKFIGTYRLRDGTRIHTVDAISVGTIAVVYLRRHYGTPRNMSCVVDIGANIGVFSLLVAKANCAAQVFSFEPEATNYCALCRNVVQNQLSERVFPMQVGIADQNCIRSFAGNLSPTHEMLRPGRHTGTATFHCECLTLADAVNRTGHETVDLVKMNCEGAEYEILYATPPDILRRIAAIRLEYHVIDAKAMNGHALAKFLVQAGYSIKRYDDYTSTDGFLWVNRDDVRANRTNRK